MRTLLFILLLVLPQLATSQLNAGIGLQQDTVVLGFREYLGYVKKYHPIAKQANLTIDAAQANLMKARGGFDPKLEIDYDAKEFKGSEYYDLLNATFKIPTWYGIELKAGFEQNDGEFLNPERTVPDDGLFNAGISVSVGRDLFINDRMATLRQAKIFQEQTKADQQLLINQLLYEASIAYFEWVKAYKQALTYKEFLANAELRYRAVSRAAELGAEAPIDTVEAYIPVQNRTLSLEQAGIDLRKAELGVSNFLWLEELVPIELQENVMPVLELNGEIDLTLSIEERPLSEIPLDSHPKLRSMRFKVEQLEVDRKFKASRLLPVINLEYNFLTETPDIARSYQNANYKGGIEFAFPLFLRKERGDLKLAKIKVQDANLDLLSEQFRLRNKIAGVYTALDSYVVQRGLIADIVVNYQLMLRAEERKFGVGDSSLFLINSRETKLIDAQLKEIELENKLYETKAKLFNTMALPGENI